MSEFDFDWTGVDPAFLVSNETQEIAAVGSTEYHIVIPQHAPFYWESVVVEYWNAGVWNEMVKDVDYTPGHLFIQATRQTTKSIYGSLVITNKLLTGVIRINYQKLGGSWSLDTIKITEILSDKVVNPRRTAWEQVADYPEQFPPIPHVHIDEEDMTGMAEVVVAINSLADAVLILAGDASSILQSIPFACGTEGSVVAIASNLVVFRMPFGFTLHSVKASLTTAQDTGNLVTVDVLKNGSSILSTLLTIENGQKTSLTASVPAVISALTFANDDEVTIDVTDLGDGTATGLKVYLIGTTTPTP